MHSVQVIHDVPYRNVDGYFDSSPKLKDIIHVSCGHKKNLELKMDLYLPEKNFSGGYPTILFFHGGAFLFDNKESHSIVRWCERFASRGYVSVSINYRLGFPLKKSSIKEAEKLAISDAQNAIDFLIENKEKYMIDPDNLFLAGSSAGAMIALQLPFSNRKNKYTIRAIANMWGCVPELELFTKQYPPLISFHGGQDTTVPPDFNYSFYKFDRRGWILKYLLDKKYGSIPIHAKLQELGVTNKLFYFPTLKHKLHWNPKQKTENEFFFLIDEKIALFFSQELNVKSK